MSNNIFDLLRSDAPKKAPSAPKVAAPKPASTAAPKTAAPKAAAQKDAAPSQNKDAKFAAERLSKEDSQRQGDRKPRVLRTPKSDFSWKEGDAKPAAKTDSPTESKVRAIAGNNRRERRAFETKIAEAANVAPQKRQFDRRSAHPAGEVKKGGFGKGNWGKPGSEVEGEARPERRERRERTERGPRKEKTERGPRKAEGETKTEEKKEEAVVPRELTEEEKKEQEEKEREAKMLTLKEYKKKAAADKVKIALPKKRAAGEGAQNDWSEFAVLEKEADSEKETKKVAVQAKAESAEIIAAHTQAVLKKKEQEKKILAQLLKNAGSAPKPSGPRRDNNNNTRREPRQQRQAASQEFSLGTEEFPSLATKAQ